MTRQLCSCRSSVGSTATYKRNHIKSSNLLDTVSPARKSLLIKFVPRVFGKNPVKTNTTKSLPGENALTTKHLPTLVCRPTIANDLYFLFFFYFYHLTLLLVIYFFQPHFFSRLTDQNILSNHRPQSLCRGTCWRMVVEEKRRDTVIRKCK